MIPTTNWMYPAHLPDAGLPDGFETLAVPRKAAAAVAARTARDQRDAALDEWLRALSR